LDLSVPIKSEAQRQKTETQSVQEKILKDLGQEYVAQGGEHTKAHIGNLGRTLA
jgi:hypothetical protein